MRRTRARTAACLAGALLIGVAIAGCGRHDSTIPPTVPPASFAQSSGPSLSPSGPIDSGASASPSDAGSAQSTPPTPDPVASELDQINQLINDINDSVQSSDSGGGE